MAESPTLELPSVGRAWDDLGEALDALSEGVAVFGPDGGLLFWNSRYVEMYAHPAGFLRVGLSFDAVVRRIAASGRVPEAVGREDEWVAERFAHQASAHSDFEHRLSDGRWIRVEEKRTHRGLSVGIRIDITALKQQEASFRLLFESNPVPILVRDRDTHGFLAVNDAALRLLGYARPAFLALSIAELCAAGRAGPLVDARPWRCIRSDGGVLDVLPYSSDFDHAGRRAAITALVDMTEIQRGREDLHRTRVFLDSVVEAIPSMVFAKDMEDDGRYVLYNRAGERLTGREACDVLGRTDFDLFDDAQAHATRARDRTVVSSGVGQHYETDVSRPDGTVRLFEMRKIPIAARPGGVPRYVLGIGEDVTDQREVERRIARAARVDDLTGMPNRLAFVEMLGDALAGRRKWPDGVALMLLDLDGFRPFNDALGHLAGDALLRAVADRLAGELRGGDRVARLGADAFGVIQLSVGGVDDAVSLVTRLLGSFDRPFAVDGRDFTIGASVGLAVGAPSSSPVLAPDLLLRHAELALKRAKAGQRGSFRIFEPCMDEEVRRRRALEVDLRAALERGQFELFYQPQVDLATEAVSGFEALLRWRHPERGFVEPGAFIGVLEETGLIIPVGRWVLAEACAAAVRWPRPVRVAVNLSPVQFITPGLMEAVSDALAATGLPPDRLDLEITESVRLIDNESNLAMLHRLREAGLQVALDDFGTGYASLSYLRTFPFSKIKLDRSFVSDLGRAGGSFAIVRAAAQLARDLGMDTIAEGVETRAQFRRVRELGCTVGQGYLFGRPMPACDVAASLAAGAPAEAAPRRPAATRRRRLLPAIGGT